MKTSTKLLIAFVIIVVLSVTGILVMAKLMLFNTAANRNYVEKTIEKTVEDFDGIDVAQGARVFLTQGDKYNVKITGDEKLLPNISTEIEDRVLKIRFPDRWDNSMFTVYITAPLFKSIKTSTAVRVETENMLKGTDLSIDMGTGSKGEFDLQYNSLECEANTGCVIILKGHAAKADLNANTGCKIDALDLQVKDCRVEGNTGVKFEVNVSDLLSVDLNTGSSLSYKGDPSMKVVNASTGSTIKKIQ